MPELSDEKKNEFVSRMKEFFRKKYYKDMVKASHKEKSLDVDFQLFDKFSPEMSELLLKQPEDFYEIVEEAVAQTELPSPVKVRFLNLPDTEKVSIRDLRSKHIGKFISVEGTVRKASEIRPEIISTIWECPDCGELIDVERRGTFIGKPFICTGPNCNNKTGFKQKDKKMVDMRWIMIEEPFELTEGDKPSQVNLLLREDLTHPEFRRMTDPGNRLEMTGVLKDIPRGKSYNVKLDFYMDVNHIVPKEMGWERIEVSKEDEKKIIEFSKDPKIYENLVDSLAPSLYGMREIKESIILQLFGGVQRTLKDKTGFRGDIHLLLVGDPASGKSQLLKLAPQIIPRGKYVSGKGVTGAGLCMSYDTLIPLAHGEIVKIGDIVEKTLENYKKPIKQGFVSTKGKTEVVCLDPKDMKIKKKKVSKYFKLKPTGKLIEFKTSSGRKIKLTKENPVLVISDGELGWKQAEDVLAEDYIATARYIPLNHLNVNMKPEFARFAGMIAGDGDVGQREIRFHNTNKKYRSDFSNLSLFLGFRPMEYFQTDRIPCVRVASKTLCDELDAIGIPRGIKNDRIVIPEEVLRSNELLSEFLSGLFTCDGGPVEKGNGSYIEYTTTSETMAKHVQTGLLRFGILSKLRERPPSKGGFGGKKRKYVIIIRGQENLKRFESEIGFTHEKKEKLRKIINKRLKPNTNVDIIPNLGSKLKQVRESLKIGIKNDKSLYMLRSYERGDRKFSREQLNKFVTLLNEKKPHPYFDYLMKLSESDIFWDRIEEKKEIEEEWVYDLTVDGEHNFVANDFIVHNTATVTKDEQFMGGWVLEAGAIVLANKGLLAIDEFEKMSQDDQVAMHEALEQGSVSIAKASIVATLPAQTSVLAGGNPKFSRFDPYMAIAKQINIPDTLLSRFDLKFILKDIPNADKDRKIVEHSLKTREDDFKDSEPKIDPEFVRKYIAYAKNNCKPDLTKESGKMVKDFYLKTRKKAEGGSAPIPITLRQFEAMIRLSESSAKIQLQKKVRKEDAQRAIKLMQFSLRQLGYDPETGEVDIDKVEGVTTSSDRSKIKAILEIINELSAKKKEIPRGDIEERAKKDGLTEVEEIIEKLMREGMLFSPTPGYVQKV
jgi:replicative DNA helicase Mcm